MRKLMSNWRLSWLLQLVVMAVVALAATLLPLYFPAAALPLRVIFLWILPCTLGPASACLLTCAGLTGYAAWIVPPVIHSALPWVLIGYPPSPASMLICAFVSLVGAAAGDVLYRSRTAKK